MTQFRCALASCFLLAGCDQMKNMIDPTGKAYGGNVDTTKKFGAKSSNKDSAKPAASTSTSNTSNSSSNTPAAPPPPPLRPAGTMETVIHQKAPGRFLTIAELEKQIPSITFEAAGRSFRFVGDIYRDRSGITSLRDSSRALWAAAIGDLNMDGSDDAVLLLRTDRPGTVLWDLAYLPNRSGKLANVQTVRLPGDDGYREAVIEGSSVVLVPETDGPNLHLSYSGGQLELVER